MRGTALLYQLEADRVLSAWSAIKREIDAVEPGSPEYVALYIAARQLRNEYQRLVEEARLHHRAALPPLPVRLRRTEAVHLPETAHLPAAHLPETAHLAEGHTTEGVHTTERVRVTEGVAHN